MSAVDLVFQHWNDALTLFSAVAAVVIGCYQVQHYRAQRPNLTVHEVMTAEHRPESGGAGYADEGGYVEGTEYLLTVRLSNKGREPTTVSEASLLTDEERIGMVRYSGSTEIPLHGDGSPEMPREVDRDLRVKGQDVVEVEFRGTGEPLADKSRTISGTVRFSTVDGNSAGANVVFTPWDPR